MKPLRSPRPLAAIGRTTTFLAVLSGSVASAQAPTRDAYEPRPAPEAPPAAFDWNPASAERELLIDAPGDGSVWALGASYKMSFDASGATFYPALGANAPRNYPHRLTPATASIADVALAFDPSASPTRHGERIEFDRGAFVEAYDLAVDDLEQTFVFHALPRRGEIVLRIPVASEFEAFSSAAGIAFRGPLGEVRYGRATAIDAAGREQAAPTTVVDGAIEIRVPADFVASARLPLVIDPVVGSIVIDSSSANDTYTPDIAWEPFHQGWLCVYEQVFSATDTDILARFVSFGGSTISGGVDLTGARWQRPRVANLAAATQFLCVAEVVSGSATLVRGRTLQPTGLVLSLGAQFDVSDGTSGNKRLPDVGGDPYGALPSHYCVVYQQDFSTIDKRVAVRLVAPDNTFPNGSPDFLPIAQGFVDTEPSISNSNNASEWLIAWTRDGWPTSGDIHGAYVSYTGAVVDGPFSIAGGGAFQSAPCASTGLLGSNLTAVAFYTLVPVGLSGDVYVALLDGSTVLQIANISTLENVGTIGRRQIQPSIDSNGAHFLVGYSELNPTFQHDELFLTDLFVSGTSFGASEAHVLPHHWGLPQRNSRITAQHGTAGSNRFAAAYDITHNETNRDVHVNLFDVADGGAWSSFCFGDDSELPCPCGNAGDTGRGCANSQSPYGALLELSGSPSTLEDSAVLEVSGVPDNQPCLFFQGTQAVAMFAFGDGLRCAGGIVIRLAVKSAIGGSASYPGTGEDPISDVGHVPNDGALRSYQAWYRDPTNFCTVSSFNISNAVSVSWAR